MTMLVSAPAADHLPRLSGASAHFEPRLLRAGLAILALMVPTAFALVLDPRTLNDVPIWIKPLKFQASIGLYLLTLSWFLAALPEGVRRGRAVAVLVTMTVAASAFEIAYITLQVARGLASHYNVGDPIHSMMYTLMGIGAVTLTAVSPAVAVLFWRHRPARWSTAFWLSVMLGLVLTFVLGAGAGAMLSAGDGHWISGVRSDAGGVPVFGWSRTGGDLRAAHFLGMHAMHVLPVIGLIAGRLLRPRPAISVVVGAASAYCVGTGVVLWLALRGIPIFPN
ncbi:hypothetical protein BB934_37970 (plasmid) [Microvirga ossetica]|uniref:Uncharacterized protein n=1 Tax=Microvirga ossetica TaxID=1882682 RepID=A0A1B2EVP6_9HYPH|nr:hypothetical protein [Microvirga ossetica]ANY84050.1 hypothetical protein BB934_37970 [Microvirga ossetica]